MLSAYFILAANSFMQNPVGFQLNPDTGRAELTDFGAVLTNKVALVTFPHTIAGAFLAAGGLVAAVGAVAPGPPAADPATPPAYRTAPEARRLDHAGRGRRGR